VKVTASKIRSILIEKFGYSDRDFSTSTVNNILNRLGHTLKKVQKTKPLKRIAETEKIFKNVSAKTSEAENSPETLRISVDVKDKVKIGELSRGGYSRSKAAVKALDKDQKWDAVLVPVGILEVESG